jgi:hypothetical protein
MTIPVLVRKILIGAAESSLDVAGSALLPGAWPILKGACGRCSIASRNGSAGRT